MSESKKAIDSKTIQFQIVMGMIDALVLGIQILAPIMDATEFAIIFFILSVIHKSGSSYLRLITSTAITSTRAVE